MVSSGFKYTFYLLELLRNIRCYIHEFFCDAQHSLELEANVLSKLGKTIFLMFLNACQISCFRILVLFPSSDKLKF